MFCLIYSYLGSLRIVSFASLREKDIWLTAVVSSKALEATGSPLCVRATGFEAILMLILQYVRHTSSHKEGPPKRQLRMSRLFVHPRFKLLIHFYRISAELSISYAVIVR